MLPGIYDISEEACTTRRILSEHLARPVSVDAYRRRRDPGRRWGGRVGDRLCDGGGRLHSALQDLAAVASGPREAGKARARQAYDGICPFDGSCGNRARCGIPTVLSRIGRRATYEAVDFVY